MKPEKEPAVPLHLFFSTFIHYCFLLLRAMIVGVDRCRVFWQELLLQSKQNPKSFQHGFGVTMERIVWRHRARVMDFSSEYQFITVIEDINISSTIVLNEYYQLYTVSREYSYFVKLPKSRQHYFATEAPFTRVRIWQEATHLVRMPIHCFHEFASTLPTDFKLLLISASARCGSTLLTRMLCRSNERTTVIACPGALTQLCFLQKLMPTEELREILKSVVTVLCSPIPNKCREFIMKFMCFELCLHEHIHEIFGNERVRFIFITRGVLPNILSWKRTMYGNGFFSMLILKLRYPNLFDKLVPIALRQSFPGVIALIDYRFSTILFSSRVTENLHLLCGTPFEAAVAGWSDAVCLYEKLQHKTEVPMVTYEELLNAPVETVRKIITFAGMDDSCLNCSGILEELKVDSQGGTPFSQKSKNSAATSIDESSMFRVKQFWKAVGLDAKF